MGTALSLAKEVVNRPGPTMGAWPRAAAFLGRQALEESLDRFWDETAPVLRRASRATQTARLPQFLDADLAADVRVAWFALSRACHHHAYEIAPTAPELDRWLTTVEKLLGRMQDARAT